MPLEDYVQEKRYNVIGFILWEDYPGCIRIKTAGKKFH